MQFIKVSMMIYTQKQVAVYPLSKLLLRLSTVAVSETATLVTAGEVARVCLFFNTGRRADLATAVAKVALSDTA